MYTLIAASLLAPSAPIQKSSPHWVEVQRMEFNTFGDKQFVYTAGRELWPIGWNEYAGSNRVVVSGRCQLADGSWPGADYRVELLTYDMSVRDGHPVPKLFTLPIGECGWWEWEWKKDRGEDQKGDLSVPHIPVRMTIWLQKKVPGGGGDKWESVTEGLEVGLLSEPEWR